MPNTNLTEIFTGIANSIRAKDRTTETIAPVDFASRIDTLPVGSNENIEWHWIQGDTKFLSQFKANVTNLDDLICFILAPGVPSSGGYPLIYIKGPDSYADNKLYCSIYQSKWKGYAANSKDTYIDLKDNRVIRNGTVLNGGEYFYRYAYAIIKHE